MTILWIILNKPNWYIFQLIGILLNKYLHVTLIMKFLHDNEYKSKLKVILLWDGFLYEPGIEYGWNRMMKEWGICHRDTLLWKEAWKVINFLGFLITLSVILIISRGKIPKFPIKLWVGTILTFSFFSTCISAANWFLNGGFWGVDYTLNLSSHPPTPPKIQFTPRFCNITSICIHFSCFLKT
jgi:hypothetical protein